MNENDSQSKFGLEVISQPKLLHWGTDMYLINRIQVVYFKRKEIWSLFAPAKAKKTGSFFFLNESNSQSKFGLEKLAPNDNHFTEELIGISLA